MTRVAVQPPTEAGGGLFLSKVKSNNEGLKRRATEAPRAAPGKEKHQNPEASPTVKSSRGRTEEERQIEGGASMSCLGGRPEPQARAVRQAIKARVSLAEKVYPLLLFRQYPKTY